MRSPEEYTAGLTGVNDKYDTPGMLKSYQTSPDQFPNPKDMVVFSGFGMNAEDYERGFCDPHVRELPDYDKRNYADRYSQPRVADENQGNTMALPKDYEFRQKELESKGFLTRPRIPTER